MAELLVGLGGVATALSAELKVMPWIDLRSPERSLSIQ